jgi:Cu(I)/Ag(I) efflux system membrane fusion protein
MTRHAYAPRAGTHPIAAPFVWGSFSRKHMRLLWGTGAVFAALVAVAVGYWIGQAHTGRSQAGASAPATDSQNRRVLYWYDPMRPEQHFDKPGKSPFMDMDLVPRYAESGTANPMVAAEFVTIDPAITQSLGVRLARATRERISAAVEAVGTVVYDERELSVVQSRVAGFVERVYGHAPGDLVRRDEALVDVLVPEWAAAQSEFVALSSRGDAAWIEAGRQRLRLLGMPAALIARLEETRTPNAVITLRAPRAGAIQALDVRAGMTLMPGAALVRINGLETVWLETVVPEAQAAQLRAGSSIVAELQAFPGAPLKGRVLAVLPEASLEFRTVKVRSELPNPEGRLRPGMYARVHIDSANPVESVTVPSEAVIYTGTRTLVMLAEEGGRYRPAEIVAGIERGGRTVVLHGLAEGEQVVASGQFLMDSEASLKGIVARAVSFADRTTSLAQDRPAPLPSILAPATTARVVEIGESGITLDHEAIASLSMPAMTMAYPLASPGLARGLVPGDRVLATIVRSGGGFLVRSLSKTGGGR